MVIFLVFEKTTVRMIDLNIKFEIFQSTRAFKSIFMLI